MKTRVVGFANQRQASTRSDMVRLGMAAARTAELPDKVEIKPYLRAGEPAAFVYVLTWNNFGVVKQ